MWIPSRVEKPGTFFAEGLFQLIKKGKESNDLVKSRRRNASLFVVLRSWFLISFAQGGTTPYGYGLGECFLSRHTRTGDGLCRKERMKFSAQYRLSTAFFWHAKSMARKIYSAVLSDRALAVPWGGKDIRDKEDRRDGGMRWEVSAVP